MKVMNPEYQKIDTIPLNILLRDKLGKSLKLDQLGEVAETVDYLIGHTVDYSKQIDALTHEYIFNLGSSAEVGAKYIIESLQEKIAKKGAGSSK